MKFKLLLPIAGIILFCLVFIFAFMEALEPVSGEGENLNSIELRVFQGAGAMEISRELSDKKIIKSAFSFGLYSFLTGKLLSFKPGIYILNSGQSSREITEILIAGQKAIPATITPGMTLREADDYLSNIKVLNQGALITYNMEKLSGKYEFLGGAKTLEGFLLPDTYLFFIDSEADAVVGKILDNFQDKASSLLDFSKGDIFEKIILASLLEKEVISPEDKKMVAGILEKRVASGMPLQVDATVVYAKCKGRFMGCEQIRRSDFNIDSPYNTYKYKGYPIAPISNPGVESIAAAMEPIKSSYWFYLSDWRTKKTIFAKTLEEQNDNKAIHMR